MPEKRWLNWLKDGKEQIVIFGKMILFAMKRINTFIIVLFRFVLQPVSNRFPPGWRKPSVVQWGKQRSRSFVVFFQRIAMNGASPGTHQASSLWAYNRVR